MLRCRFTTLFLIAAFCLQLVSNSLWAKEVGELTTRTSLRSGASFDDASIKKVNSGEEGEFLEKNGRWIKLRFADGTEGWVPARFVKLREVADPEPAAAAVLAPAVAEPAETVASPQADTPTATDPSPEVAEDQAPSVAEQPDEPEIDPGNKETIVVWQLERKQGVSKEEIDSISGIVTAQVQRFSGMTVVSQADLLTMLKSEETAQSCGMEGGDSCVVEVGAAIGAPEAISGDLGRLGTQWVVNLRRVNIREAKSVTMRSRTADGELDDLMILVPGMVAEIFGQPAPPVPGILDVESVPEGAVVMLDDSEVGKTPSKTYHDPGKHTLTVRKRDHEDHVAEIDIVTGQRSQHTVTLKRYPWNPYKIAAHGTMWSGLGVAAVGGILTWQSWKKTQDHEDAMGQRDFEAADSAKSSADLMGGLAIGAYALGGALMITGAVLFAIEPGDDSWFRKQPVEVAPMPEGDGAVVSLRGSW